MGGKIAPFPICIVGMMISSGLGESAVIVGGGDGPVRPPERDSRILCVECRSQAGDKTRENEKFTERASAIKIRSGRKCVCV